MLQTLWRNAFHWMVGTISFSFISLVAVVPVHAEVTIRVEMANTRSSLVIGSSTPATVTDGSGQQFSLPALKGVWAKPTAKGVSLNGVVSPILYVTPSEGGLVAINGRWHHGELILTGYNMILAVNRLNIEDYVASVVDAEMGSSFSPEALKAQAVAARSYALHHYKQGWWFDLHSDTRSQVYRGLPVSGAAVAATEATRGMVLVYGGEFVNAMYSSSSGGRTVGVRGVPYLQSVPDISRPKFGHGIGMSQWGAQERAKQGWSYQQILGYYYRGVGLGILPQ
jgi:stage II sporulation protein D